MRYNIGDKVQIVSAWGPFCHENPDGWMDHWLGQVMTIREDEGYCYKMEEDKEEYFGDGWSWNDACIVGFASSDADADDLMKLL